MAGTRSRSSGLFSGLVLISVGILLLLHNYGYLDLSAFFTRWWPLLIVFWGVVKLYERTAGQRFGGGGGGITGNEILLVLGMLVLMGIVVAVDVGKEKLGGLVEVPGDNFEYDLDVTPRTIPANAPVSVRNVRGDMNVRASDDNQVEVSAKKNVRAWSDHDAERIAKPVTVEITQNGDSFEVHPAGYDTSDARIGVDLDVAVPKKSPLTVKTEKGDVTISDFASDVSVTNQNGDVDVRGTNGAVLVEMRKGDVKINDTTGDVKISGKGGEIEVNDTSGSLTVEGDFYGPVRADKVTKGVRMVSPRTDLTASALAGHMEAGSGNLDLIDVPGIVNLRTRDTEVNVENPGGKVTIDNRNAQTTVRFTSAPKDDVTITNSSSGISLSIPGSSSFEVVADCRNCDIESEFSGLDQTKSESGDSHLGGKYGSGKGPKITLKTSYGNIELRRTSIEPRPMPMPKPVPIPKPFGVPAPANPPVPPSTEQ
jgi:cell wall-active antibiotic response 4TMS protein YvqF/putative adhesin